MAITRRQLLAGGSALGAAALTGACAPSADPHTITIWNNLADAQQVEYYRKHLVEGYHGKLPVRFTNKSSNTIDRLIQTSLAAGVGPSIIVTPGPSSYVSAYDAAGYLVDLDRYADRYGWRAKFAPWALAASAVGRKLVTLPGSYETMVWYDNPATTKKLGLAAPTTVDEFEHFCAEAKGRGLIPIAAGNADYKGANEWHVGVCLNHGAGPDAVYSALRGETRWTDPVFVDAIDRFAGYFTKGWFGGGVDRYLTNTFPTVYRQLATGRAAAMISGSWEVSTLPGYFGAAAGNHASWAWAPLPSLRDGVPATVWDLAIGQSLGVNTNAGNAAASVDYLNFLTTDVPTIVAAVEQVAFEPPPVHITTADFSARADPRVVRLYAELSAAATIGYTTWTFFPPRTETYMIDYFENVITGRLTAREYCAGIQSRFAAERRQGRVPAAPRPDGGLS
jgi:raffinose/stachyose/melibiose transport system substrate-binding protein